MSVNRLLLLVAILLASTVVASASIIPRPGDPDIIIDAGGLSDPLTTGTIFPGGTGTFDYYNPFSVFITGLTFEIMIAPNLDFSSDPTDVNSVRPDFNCSSGFFVNCNFAYDASGRLDIIFSGVLPEGSDAGNDANDNEAGEMEGIPPLLPGCANTPDGTTQGGVDCTVIGHFNISIAGWSNSQSPGLFNANNPNPSFDVTDVSTVPEPASGILFGSVLLIGAALARRRSLRRA